MNKTMVISNFPACGKTWLTENAGSLDVALDISVKELDSSRYNKSNPEWVLHYAEDVEAEIGKYDFIVVSMQDEFLEALNNRGIPFVTVGPNNAEWLDEKKRRLIKQQWFGRFLLRNNSHIKDFNSWLIKLQMHYDDWTSVDGLTKHNPVSFFLLNQDQYLSDIIADLYYKKEHYEEYDASKRGEGNA